MLRSRIVHVTRLYMFVSYPRFYVFPSCGQIHVIVFFSFQRCYLQYNSSWRIWEINVLWSGHFIEDFFRSTCLPTIVLFEKRCVCEKVAHTVFTWLPSSPMVRVKLSNTFVQYDTESF